MAALPEESRRTGPQHSVVVIGRRSLQNGLLALLVQDELGCACEVRSVYQLNAAPAPAGALALLDVEGMPVADIAGYVHTLLSSGCYSAIALVNTDDDVDDIALPGVQGVFFPDTSQEHLVKGIQAIFAGQYWLPRRMLAPRLGRARAPRQGSRWSRGALTPKETETLRLLVRGEGNNAIARSLGVSPHTVKTHVYNVFRKLGVKNRVQAVNWAMRHAELGDAA